ncbi:MAG: DNA polymerase III subunit gamma/tau [Paramuribaculum sp.]|nr:DNA polymerase III subunit gamma/tau [Paramuribaculum sp.]
MDNYIVSARKYRPTTFESVVGQKSLTATLKNAVATGRLAHSYLFCGPRGVGKTSCARIFAKTINCEHRTAEGEACNECDSCRSFNSGLSMNIIELDAASNNGVDDMRGLVEQVQTPPSSGKYRVFIIDEVHMLSSAAFNAFLKTLEEPPGYVVFILATTEKHKIIPTILSRCQIFDFHRISIDDMINHLAMVASKEGIEAERKGLSVIARKADGAMRDALSIFDQVAASSRGKITYQSTIDNLNVLDSAYYSRMVDCMLKGRALETWMIYKEIRDKGFDSQFMINGLAGYMRDLLAARDASTLGLIEGTDADKEAMSRQAQQCHPQSLFTALSLLNDADLNYRQASSKQLLTEITLAKICQLFSPSPAESGKDGGHQQLRPIATTTDRSAAQQPTTPAPRMAAKAPEAPIPIQKPTTTTATATTTAAPEPRTAAQRPVARPAVSNLRGIGGGGTVSIRTGARRQDATAKPTAENDAQAAQKIGPRAEAYTQDALTSAWDAFAAARPKMHILVNTMRASHPVAVNDKPHQYMVTVENEMQRDMLQQCMPELRQWLRDSLRNDSVGIELNINQGETARHTWNDREVYARLLEEQPGIKRLADDLKLTLQ